MITTAGAATATPTAWRGFVGQDWRDGVDVRAFIQSDYTPYPGDAEMLRARRAGIVTGLPDAYGRGRIIGDHRWVALYGVDALIEAKQAERPSGRPTIQRRHDPRPRVTHRAHTDVGRELEVMAGTYGCDVFAFPNRHARPSSGSLWAISPRPRSRTVPRYRSAAPRSSSTSSSNETSPKAAIDERGAQEPIDDFVIKLRIARFLRTPEYEALFRR